MTDYEITYGAFVMILAIICVTPILGVFFYMDNIMQGEVTSLTEKYVSSMNDINMTYENEMNSLNFSHLLEQENLTSYFAGEMVELNLSHTTMMNNLSYAHEVEKNVLLQQLVESMLEINLLRSGDVFNLHRPTYLEVLEFMEEDKTDENEYVYTFYECDEFSEDVNSNAEAQGIRTAVVLIEMGTGTLERRGHVIVGFNTIDSGMVYFEPQDDRQIFNIEVGNNACDDCNLCFSIPNHTIVSINIYW